MLTSGQKLAPSPSSLKEPMPGPLPSGETGSEEAADLASAAPPRQTPRLTRLLLLLRARPPEEGRWLLKAGG